MNEITEYITFKKINDKFSYGVLGEFKVIIMVENGYFNATKLCKNGGKQLIHWMENKSSKKLIKNLEKILGSSKNELIIKVNGGKLTKISGSYVNPALFTNIASWCSNEFAIKISIWIEEWKKYSKNNNLKYWDSIKDINFDFNDCDEKNIQLKLKDMLHGQIEVPTPVGDIDLLTESEIIEIKNYENWKYALGQILAYSNFYPEKNKCIYLFNVPTDGNINQIRKILNKYGIKLKII